MDTLGADGTVVFAVHASPINISRELFPSSSDTFFKQLLQIDSNS